MTRSNGRSKGKEDITQVKAPVYNTSIVTNENECRDLLLIKGIDGYKVRKEQHQKVHTQFSPQKLLLS